MLSMLNLILRISPLLVIPFIELHLSRSVPFPVLRCRLEAAAASSQIVDAVLASVVVAEALSPLVVVRPCCQE